MNIQCQQCGTSYAVADDKVRGRLMKVRCKSCSEPIRVDGTLLDNTPARPSLASAPPGFHTAPAHSGPAAHAIMGVLERPEAEGATWHIAVGDSTQGPYTLDELREHYQSGAVTSDTLVYCEGTEGDWRAAGEIPQLQARAVAPPPTQPFPSQRMPAQAQSGALAFSSGVSMGSDPFSEQRAAAARSLSPRVSAEEMLDGAPREQTVQFSIDQIRALSSVSAPSMPQSTAQAPMMNSRASASGFPARMTSSTAGGYGSSGYAGGDGSGLIDVRKLAELHLQMTQQETTAALSEPLIPASGSYAHTLAPLSLPLSPAGAPRGGIDGRTKLVAGLAAFGMVLAAAVGVLALTRPPVQATAAVQPPTQDTAAAAQPVAEDAAPEVAAADADRAEPTKAPAAADKDEAAEPRTASASSSRGKKAKRGSGGAAAKRAGKGSDDDEIEDEPAPSKASKASKSNAKSDIDDLLAGAPSKTSKSSSAGQSIDDLLDNAVSGKKSAPKAEEKAPSSSLPMTPGREDMLSALNKAKAKAAKCKGPGVATAAIQISGSSGKATSVSVSGVEGAAGTCVEKAVRSTAFPKFQKDKFEVKFPFKLAS